MSEEKTMTMAEWRQFVAHMKRKPGTGMIYQIGFDKCKLLARELLKVKLAECRPKLGEVKTTLTYEIGHRDGVKAFSANEIQWVYGVDRATAYRWKKCNAHPFLEPAFDSLTKIRWVEDSSLNIKRKKNDDFLEAKHRFSCIETAIKAVKKTRERLEDMDFNPRYYFPIDEDLLPLAAELVAAAKDVEDFIKNCISPPEPSHD